MKERKNEHKWKFKKKSYLWQQELMNEWKETHNEYKERKVSCALFAHDTGPPCCIRAPKVRT